MHGEVNSAGDHVESAPVSGGTRSALTPDALQRRTRHTRRWCGLGFVLIPCLQAIIWSQYNSIVNSDGAMMVGEDLCDCRATLARWVSDYFWTQMIWLPANTLAWLVWGALAFKLWGRHVGRARLRRS